MTVTKCNLKGIVPQSRPSKQWIDGLFIFLLWMSLGISSFAQVPTAILRGRVTDPSGAVIPKATVTASDASGKQSTATTNNLGAYEIKGLPAGSYSVTAVAPGFSQYAEQGVSIVGGQPLQFDIALGIQVQEEKVNVEEQGLGVSVDPSENASALIIKGKDLDALSDDPDELQSELEALAGPSAGPNGGQIYIDGFTGGQIPPKSSIREIRVNQDPFSAEYDKLGYGRIEIFTKPGTDQYHGQFFLDGNDSAFNSLNPFISSVPPYNSEFFMGSLSGPITKKASFFFDGEHRNINDASVVTATVLPSDCTLNSCPFTQLSEAIPSSRTRTELSPRFDFQLTPSNTLTVRYQYFLDNESNQGIGQFSLPSQSYNSNETEHTLQISDTQVLSTNVVNETRFQYIHDGSSQNVQNLSPTISVLGAFTGGGNSSGNSNDSQNHYELQNYTSMVHGKHLFKFGGRLRILTDSNASRSGFNSTYTYSSLTSYQNQLLGFCTVTQPTSTCGPSQFSVISGQPTSSVNLVDVGVYVDDTWRFRPNITISYGLRYETQNQISDYADFGPRVSVSWGVGGTKKSAPKTVLRAGFGMFYDRFPSGFVLQADRLNGVTQQQTIIQYAGTGGATNGGATSPTIYQLGGGLRAPYTMESALSVERQIVKSATVSLTYLNSLGDHQLFLRNANAPLPGTYDPSIPGSGVRPFGGDTNIYQYDSEGVYRENQLIANFRVSWGARVSLFGFYTFSYANSDLGTSGASSTGSGFGGNGGTATANFITHQYDPIADYGRAAFDVRNRFLLGGTISLPKAFRLSPFLIANSGAPFDITVGQDLNGDSIFNDRPAVISGTTCAGKVVTGNNVCTPFGTFNTLGLGGSIVPINSQTGPTVFSANLRVSKTFGFGPETKGAGTGGQGGGRGGGRGPGGPGGGLGGRGLSGAGGGGGGFGGVTTNRRYNLTFSVSARNVLNRVNYAAPIGNLASPLFGESNSLAGPPFSNGSANRRIDLQALLSF